MGLSIGHEVNRCGVGETDTARRDKRGNREGDARESGGDGLHAGAEHAAERLAVEASVEGDDGVHDLRRLCRHAHPPRIAAC